MKINKYSQLCCTSWDITCFSLYYYKKAEKDTNIALLKDAKHFWWKELVLKVDLKNKMLPQLWLQ